MIAFPYIVDYAEARYIADEGYYCPDCGYLISVHVEDEPCPTETVAMERWGGDR